MTDVRTTAEALEGEVLAHAVRVDGATGVEDAPLPEGMKAPAKSPAEWAYRRTILYIAKFEEMLSEDEEVAIGFTDGGAGLMRIEGMGHFDPDMITFYGTDRQGAKVQLIQHVSQLSVTLKAMPKARPDAAPRRIGFQLRSDIDEAAGDDTGAGAD